MRLAVLLLQLAVADPGAPPPDPAAPGRPRPAAAPSADAGDDLVRITTRAPVIDGRDDDEVWSTARVVTDFRQFEPREDAAPSFRTEARITYDARNLYVVVRSFDPRPDSIIAVLGRRDAMTASDYISLSVDSYHDKRTGFRFELSAAGTMGDMTVFADGEQQDRSWDAIWEGKARIDSLGWVAEYRIPLSQLRYAPAEENTFGIHVMRRIGRRSERVSWPLYRRSRTGFVNQWADVPGFRGLATPRRTEIVPYTVGRYANQPRGDGTPNMAATTRYGADMKLGLTSNVTLDATINPDFGQVEADPAVVNLTAFEQFFAERRPFFLEGAGTLRFDTSCNDGQCTGLFYSRRLGRSPQLRGTYGDAGSPLKTDLVGAAKLTGRLANGLSFALLDAVSERSTGTEGRTIEPTTNYAVGRLQQDLRGGMSQVGAMLTATTRQMDEWTAPYLRSGAVSGGVDGRHRFAGNRWELRGFVAGSRVTGSEAAIARTMRSGVHFHQRPDADHLDYDTTRTSLAGYATSLQLGKVGGGITRMQLSVFRTSAGFEINDVGFKTRADEQGYSGWFGLQPIRPVGPFRIANLNVNHWTRFNTDGLPLTVGGNVNGYGEFRNFWSAFAGIGTGDVVATYDDRAARGGPALRNNPFVNGWAGVTGDRRGRVIPFANLNAGRRTDGRSSWVGVSPGVEVRLGGRMTGALQLSARRSIDDQQWYGNVDDGGVVSYTFARLDQFTTSATMRLNYTFTPRLSIESWVQPFVSTGAYADWRALADGRAARYADRFVPYTERGAPEGFRVAQFRTNNVLRWEYRPGSALFVVWAQGRDASQTLTGTPAVADGWSALARRRPDNVFLVKASYWFGR